ncbi:MAG: HIT domain-containing protein [Chloroflexi bacterium]|nr:HIT domain-containing protein [Chloroflexota bacterium]
MEHLWSPWRMDYFSKKEKGCALCKVLKMPDGPENLVVFRGGRAYVILNRYPYTSGALMVVAMQHQATLEDLDAETRAEMMELATRAVEALRRVYQPQGFNVGINIGEAAGAGIVGHIHIHVVPRWNGDTNFMTSLGGTRVLPEALAETWRRLAGAWS